MQLLIIRHGQSQADLEERHEGRADFPLSQLGYRQAAQLAKHIKQNHALDRIITSPLRRASVTAQIIGEHMGLEPTYDENLMERDNGLLAGMLRSEALERYPYPASSRQPHERFWEGESEFEFRSRVEHFFSELTVDPTSDARIAIVAHGGTITMLFRAFLNLPMQTPVWLHTADTGMHLWFLNTRYRQVLFSNQTEHLNAHKGE